MGGGGFGVLLWGSAADLGPALMALRSQLWSYGTMRGGEVG